MTRARARRIAWLCARVALWGLGGALIGALAGAFLGGTPGGWDAVNALLGAGAALGLRLLWMENARERLLEALEERFLRSGEERLLRSGANPPPVAANNSDSLLDSFDSAGQLAMRQIQREREATQSARRDFAAWRVAFQGIDSALALVDASRCAIWANRAFADLLKLRLPEDIGEPLAKLAPHPKLVALLDGGRKGSADIELADAQTRWLRVSLFPAGHQCVLTARDVTVEKQQTERAQELLADFSHEMFTPLTVIKGYLELMESGATQAQTQRIQTMQRQLERIESLLGQFVKLAELSSEPAQLVSPGRVELAELAQQAIAAVEDSKGARSVTCDCPASLTLQGEPESLLSVLINLLSNAIRHTGADGQVSVRCWREERGVCVAVSDDGEGMAASHIPRLTERFYRVDSSRGAETGGSGLGLAIVAKILHRHGARLEIESSPGAGSQFTCVFPVAD